MHTPNMPSSKSTRRSLFWLGLVWAVTGEAERIVGWISGSVASDTEAAMAKVAAIFDQIPLLGNDTAQVVMTTMGIILMSVAACLWWAWRSPGVRESVPISAPPSVPAPSNLVPGGQQFD